MDVGNAIRGRRSIRVYRPEPVAEEIIQEILDEARWAPSWANTQPWSVYVVSGEALERLKSANREQAESGKPSAPDVNMPRGEWPANLRERTAGLIQQLNAARAAKGEVGQRSAVGVGELFGATCLLLFCIDKGLVPEYACFDTGSIVQSVCLAAHARGLGTCIMVNVVRCPEALRQQLPGAGDKHFVVGVALGYPDWEAPINRFERQRADLDEVGDVGEVTLLAGASRLVLPIAFPTREKQARREAEPEAEVLEFA